MRKIFVLSLFLIILTGIVKGQQDVVKPGEIWKDVDGNLINSHGAGIMEYKGTYYLYGEIKNGNTWLVPNLGWECYRVPAGGISCYSSKDLLNWKNEGFALATTTNDPTSDIDTGKVIERPKVVYNKSTGKFVMWMHIDSKDYSYARSGVAVSDSPNGPFVYINSVRPNGNMARDMTLFQDDDGKVYHFYSSEENSTMHISLLSDDYLSHTKTEKRILINQSRESPAVFKYNKKYYVITSGTTGWSPNPAAYAVANSVLGEWTNLGNPCIGSDADKTFYSQSTYVLPLKKNSFIYLGDRWNKLDLKDSRMVWLPIEMKDGKPEITWKSSWKVQTKK